MLHSIDTSEEESVDIVTQKLNKSIKEWKEMKVNQIKQREQYILDYHHTNIDELEEKGKNKKKVIEAIKQKLKRNHSFYYITKHAGKGVRGNLKRLHEVIDRGQIINTYVDKESIEAKIMDYNVKHFTQAY